MLSSPLPFPQLPPSYSFWVEKLPKTVSRENIQFRVMTKNIQNKFIVRNCHLKNWWDTGTTQCDITVSCPCPPPFPSTRIILQFLGWESPQNCIQGKCRVKHCCKEILINSCYASSHRNWFIPLLKVSLGPGTFVSSESGLLRKKKVSHVSRHPIKMVVLWRQLEPAKKKKSSLIAF